MHSKLEPACSSVILFCCSSHSKAHIGKKAKKPKNQEAHWAEQWNGTAGLPVCRRPGPGYVKRVPRGSDGFVRILRVGSLGQISANNNELFTSILHNSLWVCLPQKPMREEGCDPVTAKVFSNPRSSQHSKKSIHFFFLMPERPRFNPSSALPTDTYLGSFLKCKIRVKSQMSW